ncbi:MAG: hypothetical protein HY925_01765 [Elusimicrobia bacterium]|nr:hypothetical protein [Elusimicrobiota bacterium]
MPSRAWKLESLASRYRSKARNVRIYIEELERAAPVDAHRDVRPWADRWAPRIAAGALLGIFVVFAPGVWKGWRDGRSGVVTLKAPVEQPVGLAAGSGELVTFDAARGLLVHLERDGRGVRRAERIDSESVGAFAWTGDVLWTADSRTGTIRRHGDGVGRPTAATFHEPYQRPRALAAARDALWILDSASRCINEYERGAGLKLRRRYPLEGFVAGGLAVHGRDFWVVDEAGKTLRLYVAGEDESWMLRGLWSLDGLIPRHGPTAGLAIEGRSLWLMTTSPVELRRIRISALGGR